jgi:hypothetical protein
MPHRIYVDFNSRVAEDRIIIPLATAAENATWFRDGESVTLYDEELEVQAILEFSRDEQWWIGVVDWSTRAFLG